MRILIIAATHGDELLGVKLYEKMLADRSPLLENVDFIIGNPKAYSVNKRYIDSDLNRSYRSDNSSYEVQRAKEIKKYIDSTKPDMVLDMHTTNCIQPSCLIINNTDGKVKRRFLAGSHINILLQVKPLGDIAAVVENVVGYEVSNGNIASELLENIELDLSNFIKGEIVNRKKQLFTMTDKIYKKDITKDQASSFINFEMNSLGFVPIMTGENSYKKSTDYVGFKSLLPESIDVG